MKKIPVSVLCFFLFGFVRCVPDSSDSANIKIKGQIKGLTTFQLSSDSNSLLVISPIGKNDYYFQLIRNKNESTPIFIDGVFERETNLTKVVLLSSPLQILDINFVDDANLHLSFKNLTNGHVFKKIIGNYIKLDKNPETPIMLFNDKNWDEMVCTRDTAPLQLYEYPSIESKFLLASAKRNSEARCFNYLYLQSDSTAVVDFLYVSLEDNIGWVKSDSFFKSFYQKYRCEKLPNGTIVKDNRQEKYVVYTDSTGKVLKRENY